MPKPEQTLVKPIMVGWYFVEEKLYLAISNVIKNGGESLTVVTVKSRLSQANDSRTQLVTCLPSTVTEYVSDNSS